MSNRPTNLYLPYSMVGNGVDTSDATITPETVLKDYVGYGREGRVVGEFEPSSGGMSVAKITEYVPYRAEYTAITEINVSGIGTFGGGEEDFTSANGKYVVTPETADKAGYERVYKHESADYWIKARVDEWDEWGGDGWQFVQSLDSDYGFLYLMPYDLTSGTREDWENGDWGEYMAVTLEVTTTTFPEQPLVLNGIKAISYDETNYVWTWGESCSFIGFENEPKKGQIFAFDETQKLIGDPIGYDPADLKQNALFYCSNSSVMDVSESGHTLTRQASDGGSFMATTMYGVPCVTTSVNPDNYGSGQTNECRGYIWTDLIPLPHTPFDDRTLLITLLYGREYSAGSTPGLYTNPSFISPYTSNQDSVSWGFMEADGNVRYGLSSAYKTVEGVTSDDVWFQLAFVCRNGTCELWRDGKKLDSFAVEDTDFFEKLMRVHMLAYGKYKTAWTYISDCYVFDRALSAAEIKRAWTLISNQVTPPEFPYEGLLARYDLLSDARDSVGQHDGTVVGNIQFADGCATNFSTDNYIQLPGGIIPDGQTAWSIGLTLVKPTGTNYTSYDFAEEGGQGLALCDDRFGSANYVVRAEGTEWAAVYAPNVKRVLLTIVNDPVSGEMRWYRDGEVLATAASRNYTPRQPITLGALVKNGIAEGALRQDAKIRDVFIYGRALSTPEVGVIYKYMRYKNGLHSLNKG